ncbi:MAG TPA: Mov34/MPN/PAD-1 family protein [Nitrososphaerales archaeon]|nr:Mov34/MPN/PAD-1 family protein [Nitrososphaerales archaeon]
MPIREVHFARDVVDSLLSYSKMAYPNEGILLLRGKRKKGVAEVTGVMIPPAAVHARAYSSFNWWMVPIDMTYLGIAHSHPSGNANPSQQDLLHASGGLMVIMGYPYANESCLGVFDKDGNRIPFYVNEEDTPNVK